MKFFGVVERGTRNCRLHVGGDPAHDPAAGIFKRFFIYYCDSHTQAKIKHENPRLRFELSECFLVVYIFN